ncbi:MAG: hypothetical protein ACYCOO_11625 [Chitinophagaceae bacterium]
MGTSLGILNGVKKERGIYYLENIKFHLDNGDGLGNFLKIEAIDPYHNDKFLKE